MLLLITCSYTLSQNSVIHVAYNNNSFPLLFLESNDFYREFVKQNAIVE